MNLQHRIEILEKLGNYILSDDAGWKQTQERAAMENTWFTHESILLAGNTAARYYLNGKSLYDFAHAYKVRDIIEAPVTVGLVMAGNIPLVGFHDFRCIFLSRHKELIKPCSKDSELIEELAALADDVHQYFGLGCSNVTKIFVPKEYDFVPLLEAFKKYSHLADHHKYKNNYDYQLAVLIINKLYYMTNGSILLVESPDIFAPISQLHYSFYEDVTEVLQSLKDNQDLQCTVGVQGLPLGSAQQPSLTDFADGTDTMKFLLSL